MISWEDMLKITKGKEINFDEYGFTRQVQFTVCGIDYFVEWWKNQGYLSIARNGANKIIFDSISVNSTWPTHMGGLRFENNGEIVALVEKEKG